MKVEKVGGILSLVVSVLTVATMLGFPELYESYKTEQAIGKEVHKIALEFPTKIEKKYKSDSVMLRRLIYANKLKAKNLEIKINTVHEMLNEINTHTEFNTIALSITSSALLEEMDKRQNGCGWNYYETNGGDNWAMFPDKYNSQILYSVDLRSDCRAYYTPIFESKTQIQF